ncbi:MAG: D-alanyl-D-alanine carboxypeptidase [Lachnospiraceae bacterium]|nr:D-alanyl-D-alanine carboxypeptidase [Lachnospiraceae bacterium]
MSIHNINTYGFNKNLRRQISKRMVFICIISLFLSLAAPFGSFKTGFFNNAATVQAKKNKNSSNGSNIAEPPKGTIGAKCAILMELKTGTVLYAKNIHEHKYPASITKILTTYLACENCSGDEYVTFSKKAVNSIGWDAARLWPFTQAGEKITMNDCYYGMMLASANEVCYAVAEHISGSVKKFSDLMNQTVADLGLKDSHFVNPNGLHDDDHYTSAYDMAVITRAAMMNQTFRNVTSTKNYKMKKTNKSKKRDLINHHSMISGYSFPQYEYKYCIGGKTGYTSKAGNTLVTVGEKNGLQLICVVLDDVNPEASNFNEYSDTISLFNYGFENYNVKTMNTDLSEVEENLFSEYTTFLGDESPISLSAEPSVVIPKGVKLSELKQNITYTKTSDFEEGKNVIGHIVYTYNGEKVGSADIIYDTSKIKDNALPIVNQKTSEKTGTQKVTGFVSKLKNKLRFNWVDVQAGFVNFVKTRKIYIILLVLFIILVYFIIMRSREIRRTTGRNRFTKEEKDTRKENSEGGFLNFSGKKNMKKKASGKGGGIQSESGGPTFTGGRKSAKTEAKKVPKEERGGKFTFFSKKKTEAARKSSPYGMANQGKRKRFKKNRRYSWTEMPAKTENKAVPPNMNSKKNQKRHKKTISSFDKNMYN